MSRKTLDVKPLITKKVLLENFHEIYKDISNSKSIASIIEYAPSKNVKKTII